MLIVLFKSIICCSTLSLTQVGTTAACQTRFPVPAGADAFPAAWRRSWMAAPGRNPSTFLMPSRAGGWSRAPERCPARPGPALHCCCSPGHSQALLSASRTAPTPRSSPSRRTRPGSHTPTADSQSYEKHTRIFEACRTWAPPPHLTLPRIGFQEKTVSMHSQKSNPASQDL